MKVHFIGVACLIGACNAADSHTGSAAGGHDGMVHQGDGSAGVVDPVGARPAVACGMVAAEDMDPDPDVVEVALVAEAATWDAGTGAPIAGIAYNGQVPGPLIQATAGQTLRVRFTNALDVPTTIHWHGLRVPVGMDGAHPLSPEVPAGGAFTYEFRVDDPGLYWYHPHMDSDSQVERGLYAPLLVLDPKEPKVDCDAVLVLDDVLLDDDGQLAPFGTATTADGRLGDHLLVNGRADLALRVRPGAPALLRLVNVANARTFELEVPGHTLTLVASDGGYVPEPISLERVRLSPGERLGVVVTPKGAAGDRINVLAHSVAAHAMGGHGAAADPLGETPQVLLQLALEGDAWTGSAPSFPAPVLPEWTAGAPTHRWILDETMDMSGAQMTMTGTIDGEVWPKVPVQSFQAGALVTLEVANEGTMAHPFHMHGQRFQVVATDGLAIAGRAWKDTVQVESGAALTLMSQMDNPGDWLIHCHILEHAESGMVGKITVQ